MSCRREIDQQTGINSFSRLDKTTAHIRESKQSNPEYATRLYRQSEFNQSAIARDSRRSKCSRIRQSQENIGRKVQGVIQETVVSSGQ